jgi:hypothetical protein
MAQHPVDLAALVPGIERYERRADVSRRKAHRKPVGLIAEQNPNAIPALHAECKQRAGSFPGTRLQFAEADHLVEMEDGGPASLDRGHFIQHGAQRAAAGAQ